MFVRMLSAFVFLGALGTTAAFSSTGCLCTSDQSCWPSDATFKQFESQLSQPLVYPRPTASGCYPLSDPSGNCTEINDNWGDGNWRSSLPGSLDFPNWETILLPNGTIEACFLNTSITGVCEQGAVPTIGIDARSVADVQAAIAFAMENNLKLVVKNTGHDFAGRSTGPGAFQVWTHNMNNATYDAAFVPQGAPGNETYEALTIGAGVEWIQAYNLALEHGRMMVGGISTGGSVGAAGGWLTGGGHSFLSPNYGLGVDNVLEMSIALSTGEYLTTNEYQNSDLFWALRGGGGCTFGIVTSVTYRTYPVVPVLVWVYQGNLTNSSALPELFEEFLYYQMKLTDEGWGGYGGMTGQQLNFQYYAPNMTNETAAATTQGWTDFAESLAPYGLVSSSSFQTYTWSEIISIMDNSTGEDGGDVLISSRLMTKETMAKNGSQVAEVLLNIGVGFNIIAGGKVNQVAPDAMGLHPAWRDAFSEATYGVSWDETTSGKDIQDLITQFKGMAQQIYDVTPNDGAYLNEASPYEVNWQQTLFGSHYPKLKSIKDKYDPNRLFVVTEGVGSDDWNKNLTCRFDA